MTVTGVMGDSPGMSLELHELLDVDAAGRVRFGVVGDQLELEGTCPAVAVAAVVVEELEAPAPIAGQFELGQEA